MGMYTLLQINVDLSEETPIDIVDIIEWMVSPDFNTKPGICSDTYPILNCEHASSMFSSGSAYFDEKTITPIFQKDKECYYLTTLSNFKNYDNEVLIFVDMIKPYLIQGIITSLNEEDQDEGKDATVLFSK